MGNLEVKKLICFLNNKKDKLSVFNDFYKIKELNENFYEEVMFTLLTNYYKYVSSTNVNNSLISDFKLPKDILYNEIFVNFEVFEEVLNVSDKVLNMSTEDVKNINEVKLLNWDSEYEFKRNIDSIVLINSSNFIRNYILNYYYNDKNNVKLNLDLLKKNNPTLFNNIMMISYGDFKKIENCCDEDEKYGICSIDSSEMYLNLVNASGEVAIRVLELELKYLNLVINGYDDFLEIPNWVKNDCIFNDIEFKLKKNRKF